MIATPGKAPRLVPVAYRHFKPKGLLYCSYEVLGMSSSKGQAHIAGGYALRTASGKLVNESSPTPISVAPGGGVMRLLAFPLDGLEPGSYELVLDVVDQTSGRTLQSRERFALE
jgi:hypothetical protein